jgi:hypothetical protein
MSSTLGGSFTGAVRVADRTDDETARSLLVGLRAYCNGAGAIIWIC